MAISKVIYKSSPSAQGEVWMDATPATAAAADIISPKTAMLANGVMTQGTGSGGSTPTGNINISQAGQTDVTNYATATVPAGGIVATVYAGITPTISVDDDGLISASAEEYARESVIHQAGWIDTPGEIIVYKLASATEQLPTQSATTITPSTTAQTAVAKGKWTTGAVTVAAMPSGTTTAPTSISGTSATVSTGTNTLTLTKTVSVTPRVTTAGYVSAGTAGNSSVSLTASVTTRAAGTITPTKSTQTIPSGTYLTGTQTIAAIPAAYQDVTGVTATASDVVSGKDIVNSSGTVVHGSLVVQNYYTGSSAPASNLGSNGDLYFQTTGGQ